MPAGTLTEALIAFREGADGVYFGMKEFSARKGAGNFSAEDMRKIRAYALEHDRKIYVAVNTLVSDEDIPAAYRLLHEIAEYGCDGVIAQDLGIAAIIRRDFPSLPLHGSTQMAVHTAQGVKALKSLGFTRAVLSRELSLKEIEAIRKACPDIELKVFIHGALCYGFSGLCMASYLLAGRSANEGSCAQICRSWFSDPEGRRSYPFSLQDLDGADYVQRLMDIGIDSLKVEGRLKGPDYAMAVTRYYRAAIDGKDYKALEKDAAIAFRRKSGYGYLDGSTKGLTTGLYTGHRGYPIGKVTRIEGRDLYAECSGGISSQDGLMTLDGPDAYRFRADIMRHKGKEYLFSLDKPVSSDGILYKISSGNLNPAMPSLEIRMMKKQVPASVEIKADSLTISTGCLEQSYEVTPEESVNDGEAVVRRIFSQSSGDSQLSIERIAWPAGWKSFFINSKRLKEIRRDFIEKLDSLPAKEAAYSHPMRKISSFLLPDRKLLSSAIPWNLEGTDIDGITYFILPPVRFEEDEVYRTLLKNAAGKEAMIGLSNIADIPFAKEHPEFSYFADIYLYLPNREAAELLLTEIPTLKGGYLWIERKKWEDWPFEPTLTDYEPPLFISRAETKEGSYMQNGKRIEVRRKDGLTVVLASH